MFSVVQIVFLIAYRSSQDLREAVYVFPLPEGAAVDRMRLTVGDRVIEAEIRERGEAKKVYKKAANNAQLPEPDRAQFRNRLQSMGR